MSEVSDVMLRETISYKGREFVLERPSFEVEALYTAYLEKGARDAALRFFGTPAYDAAMKAVIRDAAEHYYDWQGEFCQNSLSSDRNMAELVWIMIVQYERANPPKPPGRPLDRKTFFEWWKDILGFHNPCVEAVIKLLMPTPQTPPESSPPAAQAAVQVQAPGEVPAQEATTAAA